MAVRFLPVRTRRALALLTALACFWLSAFGALAHTDCLGLDLPATTGHRVALSHAAPPAHHQGPCLACEWQANSVSAALPAFALPPTPDTVDRTTVPVQRYVAVISRITSPRAPPAA